MKRFYKDVISLFFFFFLTIYIFNPLFKLSLRKNIIGDLGDPLLSLSILKHNFDKILSFDFKNFYDFNIFYPYKFTLAFSENLISTSLLLLPFYTLFKNAIPLYNIFIILNFIFSGFFMYLLSYHLNKNFMSSLIAGTIFAFAPFKFAHLIHLHILSTMYIPLIFLFLHKFFEKKKLIFLILSSFFFVILSTASGNLMIIVSPFILIMFFLHILKEKNFRKKYLIALLTFLFISSISIFPVYYPYLIIERLYGFKRSIDEILRFSPPSIKVFFVPYKYTIIGKYLNKIIGESNCELYMGIVPLISILFTVLFLIKFKKEISNSKILYFPLFYLIMLFLSFFLLFGPRFFQIKFLKNPFYYLFYNFFPGFKGFRTPPRFFLMFLFSSSILISYFYSLFFKTRTLILLEFLILLEYIPLNIPIVRMAYESKIKEVYKWIKEKKEEFAIMELPLREARYWDVPYGIDKGFFYEYFSAYHNKKTFNGISGYMSPLFEISKFFRTGRLILLAKTINIKYLVIHKDVYRDNPHIFGKDSLPKIISVIEKNYKDELVKVFEDSISTVYELIFPNKNFNPDSLFIKNYKFEISLTKEKQKGKLIFKYIGDNPCVLLYVNTIYLNYFKNGKLIHKQKIYIDPKHNNFLLKGESFSREIKLPKLKSGEYLVEITQDNKLIGESNFLY